jgi:SOS-response transcriptional repressor LexA
MSSKDLLERLRQRLADLNISPRRASLEANLGPDAIRDLERNPDQSPRLTTIDALAKSLEVAPEWLAYGSGSEAALTRADHASIPIRGEVAAGQWLNVEFLPRPEDMERAPIAFTPEWPRAAQYCLRVKGSSINRRASDGDLLRCIDIGLTGLRPQSGDLVIAQQSRLDGSEIEVTAKIYRCVGSTITLEPDSTDERHVSITIDQVDSDSTCVSIIAIVDMILKPTRRYGG